MHEHSNNHTNVFEDLRVLSHTIHYFFVSNAYFKQNSDSVLICFLDFTDFPVKKGWACAN
jgi:hypothetical protein